MCEFTTATVIMALWLFPTEEGSSDDPGPFWLNFKIGRHDQGAKALRQSAQGQSLFHALESATPRAATLWRPSLRSFSTRLKLNAFPVPESAAHTPPSAPPAEEFHATFPVRGTEGAGNGPGPVCRSVLAEIPCFWRRLTRPRGGVLLLRRRGELASAGWTREQGGGCVTCWQLPQADRLRAERLRTQEGKTKD